MTYQPHHLLAFGGHGGHAEESWTCGIRLGHFGDPAGVDEEDYLTTIAQPALTTWFGNANTGIHTGARLQWIKFNEIGPDGHYLESGVTHERQGLNIAGGKSGTTNAHPLQCCLVTSFRTNVAQRGLGSKGRIYTPRPCWGIDTNGDLAAGDRAAAAGTMATLLNTLDVSLGPVGSFLRPAIVSRGHGPAYTDVGPMNQIDYVIVDSQLDIQRRRAYSQSREESSAPVTY